ncbi:HD domain-containing protein [Christensenellaceae bacterium OttesenSCG-928-L17]|nr:HD domain-containing protein [Christensenellaceae bacterium OttesenSCG-928-L17]
MPAREMKALYYAISRDLTEREFLRKAQCSKKFMLTILEEADLRGALMLRKSSRRWTCEEVLELCRPALNKLSKEPEEGWLAFLYAAIIDKMYPQNGRRELSIEHWRAGQFYLRVLHAVILHMQAHEAFDPRTHICFASEEECAGSANLQQYELFMNMIKEYHILELMHIGRAIQNFDLLGHVAGVHHIAMHMARQLVRLNVPVDLPLVSAAALSHDLGKYGCRGEETQRIPYLHYYYTEKILRENYLDNIAHIAAQHSTWDLELENLPVESLLLIYADFRVKSVRDKNNREETVFYSLQDSYDVILKKLDNVDDEKRRRYQRVYIKLRDFEAYMVSRGANPDPYSDTLIVTEQKDTALLHAEEIVRAMRFRAISHNLRLMHNISSEASFADLLEDARSEKNWKNIRTYIDIFEEYFTYMTQKQKQLTMRYLYELFMHSQGDIRSQAGALYGRILASFNIVYRKEFPKSIGALPRPEVTSQEIWEETLQMLLAPDHKLAPKHRVWINYTLKRLLPSLIQYAKESERPQFLAAYFACFSNPAYQDDATAFILLDSLLQVPDEYLNEPFLREPLAMAKRLAAVPEDAKYQAAALRLIDKVLAHGNISVGERAAQEIISALPKELSNSVCFLLMKVLERLPNKEEEVRGYRAQLLRADISNLFLENLKTATPWLLKAINIQFLQYRVEENDNENVFQIATHLANLIRVSERFAVRHRAGQVLNAMANRLTLDQRNEIAVELTRSMESANDEFSKYIPIYLGRFVLQLHPKEFDEVLAEFEKYIKSGSERAACIALLTIGVLLKEYGTQYQEAFRELDEPFAARRTRMLSMLMSGLAHYNETIHREAFLVVGKYLFGDESISHARKSEIFSQIYKKMLLLIEEQPQDTLTFFNHAASFNHIYRFIVNSEVRCDKPQFRVMKKTAFFPGTFDPFSASHKAIVQEMLKIGFEVYLALDEFSWSKRTQPHMTRRHIVNMSTADLFDVYLFPDDIPVNIANPADLRRLQELFSRQSLYIAVGSDVVRNASAYKKPEEPYSIHSFHHIMFLRNMEGEAWKKEREMVVSRVKGDIQELELSAYLEDVSSTRIRDNIDHNRDISSLVDPVAQTFIYDNSLYLREPQYKEVMRPETMFFRKDAPANQELLDDMLTIAMRCNAKCERPVEAAQLEKAVRQRLTRPNAQLVALYHDDQKEPLGIAYYYATSAEFLYDEFQNVRLAEYARRHTSGRIAVLGGIFVKECGNRYDRMRMLLTEVLAECLKQDFTYAIYNAMDSSFDNMLAGLLERCGFILLPEQGAGAPIYAVDMRAPLALIEDVQQRIKAPLSHDADVVEVLRQAQNKFASAMTGLYPGRLVLSFHAGLMNHALIKLVLKANDVEHIDPASRTLGECMCVPYGKVLHGAVVPNTVTKTLHVDKAYMPDMENFKITKYPGYSSLRNQLRTIQSFNRPILLVDDLLHKGYRLEWLDTIFKELGLDVKKIIVGLLSGRGKDLMSVQERQVESVYFIPNLRYWFNESMLYPFLGGDSVVRPKSREHSLLLPSVNQILPYTAPMFISGASNEALFDLSLTCLENARDILLVLERRHQQMFGYNLTLNRLGQAMQTARVPDKGGCMHYDRNLSASVYVENDIEMLLRLKYMLR